MACNFMYTVTENNKEFEQMDGEFWIKDQVKKDKGDVNVDTEVEDQKQLTSNAWIWRRMEK